MFAAKFLQYILAGTVTACFGLLRFLVQLQAVEKDFADLFRGVDVEFRAGQLVNLLLQFVHGGGKFARRLLKRYCIQRDAGGLHFH